MKTIDIAQSIYFDLGQPVTPTLTMIDYWLNQNIGQLNVLLGTCFTVTNDSDIPNMSEEAKAIYKELYLTTYYDRLSLSYFGAGGYDFLNVKDLKQARDGDSSITIVSKTEKLKEIREIIKSTREYLTYLVNLYKRGISGVPVSKSMYIDGIRFND